jgi:hypothetical protein
MKERSYSGSPNLDEDHIVDDVLSKNLNADPQPKWSTGSNSRRYDEYGTEEDKKLMRKVDWK